MLYLASRSPRRAELLTQIGVEFCRVIADVDERPRPGEEPPLYVERMARSKARAALAADDLHDLPVLGADTAVVLDGVILGKPVDREDALRMLAMLSDRTHQVLSAVALAAPGREEMRLSVSEVTFRRVSTEERVAYWETGEPIDKAGGYAIQGRAATFVRHLQGSYSGVMGLPLFETWALLARFGIQVAEAEGARPDT